MKKSILLGTLLFVGLTFTACSDDDNANTNNNDNNANPETLYGTYELVAVNTQNPTNFNQDGTSHTNQMEESDCYDTAQITFTHEETFNFLRHYLAVSEETAAAVCDDLLILGDWERTSGGYTNGTFRLTYINGSGNAQTIDMVKEGNTIRYTNTSYPDRTASGAPTTTQGTVEYVFTKVQG